ncbi:MAG: hypothetical protein WCJ13_09100 [Coriobacteriia bacterium]
MPTRSVTLQSDRSEHDRHRTWASLHADGGLTIEGQDLGSGVEEFWGAGNTEYEWAESIQSQDVAKLVTALGHSDDVLEALAKRFSDDPYFRLQRFLDEHGIPHKFWSRIGD